MRVTCIVKRVHDRTKDKPVPIIRFTKRDENLLGLEPKRTTLEFIPIEINEGKVDFKVRILPFRVERLQNFERKRRLVIWQTGHAKFSYADDYNIEDGMYDGEVVKENGMKIIYVSFTRSVTLPKEYEELIDKILSEQKREAVVVISDRIFVNCEEKRIDVLLPKPRSGSATVYIEERDILNLIRALRGEIPYWSSCSEGKGVFTVSTYKNKTRIEVKDCNIGMPTWIDNVSAEVKNKLISALEKMQQS